jgi:CRISPR-associated endonuclease Csn1
MTAQLSGYWKAKDDPRAPRPHLPPPWPSIRGDAETAVAEIVVSHRVRKKVSGPLHKETTYGDTQEEVTTETGVYRQFVTRKKVEALTPTELAKIRDPRVRAVIEQWVAERGGDPKKAFPPYPRLGETGAEIRKVRLLIKQQLMLMAPVTTGYADLGANHHIAIFRQPDGKAVFEAVSLFEAARRLARREPVVRRTREDGAAFVMSLAAGDAVQFAAGEKQGIRIVQGVWASGAIVTLAHDDAVGTSVWRPSAGTIVNSGAKKISIDPIGRIRKAGD